MAYTFLEVTNLALREVNEVPLTEQLFSNTRGLQQYAKESVNRAYFDISGASTAWPWLQTQTTNTANVERTKLPKGQVWHDFNPLSTGIKLAADWDTFLLTDKDILSADPLVIASTPSVVRNLTFITYERWLSAHRVEEFSGLNAGVPQRIIRHPSGKFGLSPAPDKDYWVEYNVSNGAIRFTTHDSIIPFPEEFITVFVARCAYYLWKFRQDPEQAQFSLMEYKESLKDMKRVLLSNKEDRMRAI